MREGVAVLGQPSIDEQVSDALHTTPDLEIRVKLGARFRAPSLPEDLHKWAQQAVALVFDGQ